MNDPFRYISPEEQIARQIKQARSAYHLSQVQLASRLGTSQVVITRLETGMANPTLSTLKRIAEVFNLRLSIRLEPKTRRRNRAGTIQS